MEEEYVIYVGLYDEKNNRSEAFAVSDDWYEGFDTLDNINSQYGRSVEIFPTENSAIIWWKKHLTHFNNPVDDYVNLSNYPSSTIVIGRLINHDPNKKVAVHSLSLDLRSPLNCPDPETMTEEEKKEYAKVIEEKERLREAIEHITGASHPPVR